MYKKMYLTLFNAIIDVLELMEKQEYLKATILLEQACRDAEEIYISE